MADISEFCKTRIIEEFCNYLKKRETRDFLDKRVLRYIIWRIAHIVGVGIEDVSLTLKEVLDKKKGSDYECR